MCAIEICWAMVLPPIQVIGERATSFGVRHLLSVVVRHQEIKTGIGMLLNLNLHRVIAGVIAIADFVQSLCESELLIVEPAQVPVVAGSIGGAVRIERGLVDIGIDVKMSADVSD